MAPQSITEASTTLYALLEPFTADERIRIVKAALVLLGQDPIPIDKTQEAENIPIRLGEASEYFRYKNPQTKSEELAVAARYLEVRDHVVSSKREDLESVFNDARVNFDGKRFKDNIVNAMKSACLFNTGGTKATGYTLSAYGQKYVDALPDYQAARALQKPKSTKWRKPRAEKRS